MKKYALHFAMTLLAVNLAAQSLPMTGRWRARLIEDRLHLKLSRSEQWDDSEWDRTLEAARWQPLIRLKGDATEITGDAGSLRFEGSWTDRRGKGEFRFTANDEFKRSMATAITGDIDNEFCLRLTMAGMDRRYIQGLADMGFTPVSTRDLKRLASAEVTLDELKTLRNDGFRDNSLETLCKYVIFDINKEFIDAFAKAGYTDISPGTLLKLAIHHVTPAYIDELKGLGFQSVTLKEAIKCRIHDVNPELAEDLRKTGYSFTPETLVKCAIHGVDGDYIQQIRNAGYDRLSLKTLVKFRIHGLNGHEIKSLNKAAGNSLTASELVKCAIHNVSAGDIRETGSYEAAVRQAIHGRDAELKVHVNASVDIHR